MPARGAAAVPTTFRLPLIEGVGSAAVVGEFNDWSVTATPMERDAHGFTATIDLEPGRSYRYRYLLDGDRWENDWNADGYVPNEFGGDDSVLDLTDAAATPPKKKRAPRAKKAVADPAPEA